MNDVETYINDNILLISIVTVVIIVAIVYFLLRTYLWRKTRYGIYLCVEFFVRNSQWV